MTTESMTMTPFETPLRRLLIAGGFVLAADPDVVTIDNVPCTGRNHGECVGLAQNAPQYVPPAPTLSSSPTVHGNS